MAEVIEIGGPLDICRAQRRARSLAQHAGLSARGAFQAVTALTELSNHLFLVARRKGRLRLSPSRKAGRRGLEIVAEIETGGQWAVGLPSIERLVDELDAGFGAGGRLLITARCWAQRAGPMPQGLAAGPSALFGES